MLKNRARSATRAAVYGGVVLLLLLLALFARGFSQNVGEARVGGRYAMFPLFSSRSVERLSLAWNGISLRFSRGSSPAVQGWESTPDGMDILFDGGIRLHLQPGADLGGSIALSPLADAGTGGGAMLSIPFSVSGIPAEASDGAALAWTRAGRTYLLALPSGGAVDPAAGLITLPIGSGTARLSTRGTAAVAAAPVAARPARVKPAPAAPKPDRAAASKLPKEEAMPTADQVQSALAGFTDKAYAGWSGARFTAASALWAMPDGNAGFSEDIGAALLAESIQRGTWQTVLPLWTDALARQQARAPDAQLDLATSTYVGGVRDYLRSLRARKAVQVQKATGLLASSDVGLLSLQGLVPLLLDHGTPELQQSCLGFLTAARDPSRLDMAAGLGLLEALVDWSDYAGAAEPITRALNDLATKRILPAVRTTDAGVFLESAGGSSDVAGSIRCGSLLLRAGPLVSSTLASAVGRGLLTASLGLADADGMLPKAVTLDAGRVTARTGALPPEGIYRFLPTDRFLAREIPLYRQLGSGSWLWTSARILSLESTDSGFSVTLGYPAGIAHHFVIQGIRAFAKVQMHGIAWHADPTYYKYSDGWSYEPSTQTFSAKLTGKSDREEIVVTY
jgi:hypothetical protein